MTTPTAYSHGLHWLWPLGLLTLVGCGTGSAQSDPATTNLSVPSGPPSLVVVQPNRNLGVVELGKRVETFEISNSGGSDLTIKSLRKSCGCVQVELSRTTIPPGQSSRLQLTISPRQPEQRAASITIESNDPVSPDSRVVVEWVARGAVHADREKLEFGIVRPGVPSRLTLHVEKDANKVSTLCKTIVKSTPTGVLQAHLKSETVTPNKRTEAWDITLQADETLTESSGRLYLSFAGEDHGDILIPVSWQLRKAVQATPGSLFLGVGTPGETITKSVELTSDPGIPLKVMKADHQDGKIDFQARLVELNAETTRVEIDATLPSTVGSYLGKLKVQCEVPVGAVVEIPITCVVRAGPLPPRR